MNASYPADDGFAVKFDASGNVVWLHGMHGTGWDNSNSICTDASGNAYATGFFWSPTIFFSGPGLEYCSNDGGPDCFIVKYDPLGTVSWVRCIASGVGNNVNIDVDGNLIVSGNFGSATLTLGSFTLTQQGGGDVFIAKYDPDGNVLWATSMGGSLEDGVRGLSTDLSGNIFITGSFSSNPLPFGPDALIPIADNDVYLAKFDPAGNRLWARSAGGPLFAYGRAMCTDAVGNAFITGTFQDTISFDTVTLIGGGFADMFLAKYDPDGNMLWARKEGGEFSGITEGFGVMASQDGGVLVTAAFSSEVLVGTTLQTSVGGYDVLVIKYDGDGNAIWGRTAGGAYLDIPHGICSDANGRVFVTGSYTSPIMTVGNTSLPGAGEQDAFLISLDAATGIQMAAELGSVRIYPNPANEIIEIMVTDRNEQFDVTVFDPTGRSVAHGTGSRKVLLDTRDLSNGVHIVRIALADKEVLKRVVVMR